MRKKDVAVIKTEIENYFFGLDKLLILLVLLISFCGVVAIHSATLSSIKLSRCVPIQIIGIVIGFAAMLIIARIDYDKLGDMSIIIIIGSTLFLLFTAFFGSMIGGNRNWIPVGPVNIQPSEFAKAAFIITMSAHLSRLGEDVSKLKNVLFLCIHFIFYFVPVVLQGDIGSSLIYLGVFIVMLYVSGLKYRYFLIGIIGICAAVPIIWQFLRSYQRARIIYGFQPELDPLGYGYQPLVARMALSSGQLTGLGYTNGIQVQNDLLPAKQTDFIFAVIGEEFGFIGCLVILLLIIALVAVIIFRTVHVQSVSGKLICTGAAFIIAFQTCINIGMVLGVSPVIGVTLPFVSYGGSSILSLFIIIGLVQSVHVKENSIKTLQFGSRRLKRTPVR